VSRLEPPRGALAVVTAFRQRFRIPLVALGGEEVTTEDVRRPVIRGIAIGTRLQSLTKKIRLQQIPTCGSFFAEYFSMMIRLIAASSLLTLAIGTATFDAAAARTVYDGQWSLTINTERGACDSTYHFVVDINNGIVSHPNLVRLKGRVAKGGSVRVTVAAAGKSASGSGRMTRTSGRGRWTGYSGSDRCSGSWSAQKY
jgi:hypothetical protein